MKRSVTIDVASPSNNNSNNDSSSSSNHHLGDDGDDNPHIDQEAKNRRDILRRELTRMKEKDENEKLRKLAKRKELEEEAKRNVGILKLERGITILPGAAESKQDISTDIKLEERLSLKEKQKKLRSESEKMQGDIDRKFGITDLPKGQQLVAMATEFYSNKRMPNEHLPGHVTKMLTTEEINDFRMVFDMFDARNKGYITSDDLRRVASMLGFKAKRRVFNEMIEFTSTSRRGRVTFISFLELVVRLQGDGPDPLDEITKGFSLMDRGDKGYLTFSDIRAASEELKVPLSNRAIQDMMNEADLTGDGTVTIEEFKRILMQTGTFRSLAGPSWSFK